MREHLRACARCRATMRAYRAAPGVAAALFPALPPARSLLGRAHDLLAGLGSRLGAIGGGADSAGQVAAAGGTRGAGMVALAKLLAVCAGAAGGAVACVASGVLPAPLEIGADHPRAARIERVDARPAATSAAEAVQYQPAAEPAPQTKSSPRHPPSKQPGGPSEATSTGAVEYEAPPAPPPPAPPPTESGEGSSAPSGSAGGEFGP